MLDASVAAAWLFDDETTPRADAALTRLEAGGALVPQHWQLEVRNALLIAERRGRIAADEVNERLINLRELLVSTDTTPDLEAAFALARAHGLTFYDALYLELAQRRHAGYCPRPGRRHRRNSAALMRALHAATTAAAVTDRGEDPVP